MNDFVFILECFMTKLTRILLKVVVWHLKLIHVLIVSLVLRHFLFWGSIIYSDRFYSTFFTTRFNSQSCKYKMTIQILRWVLRETGKLFQNYQNCKYRIHVYKSTHTILNYSYAQIYLYRYCKLRCLPCCHTYYIPQWCDLRSSLAHHNRMLETAFHPICAINMHHGHAMCRSDWC